MQDFIQRLIVGVVVLTIVGAGLALGQALIRRATPQREGEFRLPAYLAATGLLSGAFGAVILGGGLFFGNMTPARDDFLAWLRLVVAFLGGGIYCVVTAGNWRLWLSDAGLQIRDEWGRLSPFVPWGEIVRVHPLWTQVMAFERRGGRRLTIPFNVEAMLQALEAARTHGAAMDAELSSQIDQARQAMDEDDRTGA